MYDLTILNPIISILTYMTLEHMSLSFCCHIPLYAAIVAYKYATKPFPNLQTHILPLQKLILIWTFLD